MQPGYIISLLRLVVKSAALGSVAEKLALAMNEVERTKVIIIICSQSIV